MKKIRKIPPWSLGQNFSNFLVHILGNAMTSYFHSKISWPLCSICINQSLWWEIYIHIRCTSGFSFKNYDNFSNLNIEHCLYFWEFVNELFKLHRLVFTYLLQFVFKRKYRSLRKSSLGKGQLISEWNFGVFKSPKKPTKF